jgi:hypothetical protein
MMGRRWSVALNVKTGEQLSHYFILFCVLCVAHTNIAPNRYHFRCVGLNEKDADEISE